MTRSMRASTRMATIATNKAQEQDRIDKMVKRRSQRVRRPTAKLINQQSEELPTTKNPKDEAKIPAAKKKSSIQKWAFNNVIKANNNLSSTTTKMMTRSSNANNNNNHNNSSSSSPVADNNTNPYLLTYQGQSFHVERLTIKAMKSIKSSSTSQQAYKRKLFLLPSVQQREAVYTESALAIADFEQSLLPLYGSRKWQVTCRISEGNSTSTLFRFYKGELELATLPHLMEKIPIPPKWPGQGHIYLQEVIDDVDNKQNKKQNPRLVSLQEREVSALSSAAWEYRSKYVVPNISLKWKSPIYTQFTSRKAAWDAAMELAKQEVLIQKFLHGIGAGEKLLKPFIPTLKQTLQVGKARFERDGLWVVNQEISWQKQRQEELHLDDDNKPSTAAARKPTGLSMYLNHFRRHEQERVLETTGQAITLRQAEQNLRAKWKTELSANQQESWHERAQQKRKDLENAHLVPSLVENLEVAKAAAEAAAAAAAEAAAATTTTTTNPMPSEEADVAAGSNQHLIVQQDKKKKATPKKAAKTPTPTSAATTTAAATSTAATATATATATDPAADATIKFDTAMERCRHRFCLTPEQISLCHEACLDHYNQVMRTVNARDLTRELQDGFDVLRERGRGRYDMELPAFDDESLFGFLTCLKTAPWMPIVRQILGEPVALIHKGCFLSLPGSEPQQYHQDGVHLTSQTQRPCHAINVFIPLIDLQKQHGPTEFCLGSHVLGQEGYDREFIYTPLVPAGTPVIFDYRLGHRGMGNSSTKWRPIVYCTYARATATTTSTTNNNTSDASNNNNNNNNNSGELKPFRDSINFSKRRYHKIGEMIERPLSRSERTQQRLLRQEEADLQRALEESKNNT